MTIFVNAEYKCHLTNDGTMREVETDFFDGKCAEFIEGYKYDDSLGYPQIYPWLPYTELAAIQAAVDRADKELADLIEEIYNYDLGVIENV